MPKKTIWGGGDEYEKFMGRWSRLVSYKFINWLNIPSASRWLDIGCGTGVLASAILEIGSPYSIYGIDPSEQQINFARNRIISDLVEFFVGDITTFSNKRDMFD